jgi:hypothetical protein
MATAYLWRWLTDAQRAEAIESAATHGLPSVRLRVGQCREDEELARASLWVRSADGTWAVTWGLWSGDLEKGVRVATPEERAR